MTNKASRSFPLCRGTRHSDAELQGPNIQFNAQYICGIKLDVDYKGLNTEDI